MKAKELIKMLRKLSKEDLEKEVVMQDNDSWHYEVRDVQVYRVHESRAIDTGGKEGKEVVVIG